MRRLIVILVLLYSSFPAWSACTVSTTNGAFGSVTSFVLNSNVQTTANLIVRCDAALNLLTNDSVTLTLTGASATASNRGTLKRTDDATITDAIPVRVCGQSGCANSSEATISGNSYTPERRSITGAAGNAHLHLTALLSDGCRAECNGRALSGYAQLQRGL